ncbi:MAG: DUF262 domain-containing HNH endonuclease family protein [Fimbriimonadaceae bacterium]
MLLNPKHLTLGELLSTRLLRIPDYQRAYAWGTRQRDELFGDINEAFDTGQDHFMATVVFLLQSRTKVGADRFQLVDIVDGQQRLTTLVILLRSIQKLLSGKNPQEAKIKREFEDLLVKGDSYSLLLIQTNHDSSNICSRYLMTGDVPQSDQVHTSADRNLFDAIVECEAYAAEWVIDGQLVDLVATLRNSLSMIVHELTDERIVYKVFEVLNSRGLDVKWIDKVKSQLMAMTFGLSSKTARREALNALKAHWVRIYNLLGLERELGDEALRFAGSLKAPERPNKLLSEEDAAEAFLASAEGTLGTLTQAADHLESVVKATKALHDDPRLRAVARILHARFVAVAIALRRFPKQKHIELMATWERVTFRIFGLGRADTRTKVGDYVRLGHDIGQMVIGPDEILSRLRELGEGHSVQEAMSRAPWGDSYDGWTEELRYVLFRYDEHLAKKSGEALNQLQWKKIWSSDPSRSIEHIQPQSSKKGYIHHIGNLAMLPPGVNSTLRDKPPKAKSEHYRTSGIRGTMNVGKIIQDSGGWNQERVKARAAELLDFIEKTWGD